MRAGLAMVFAMIALVAAAASAAAVPPTSPSTVDHRFVPVSLRLTEPSGDDRAKGTAPPAIDASAPFIEAGAAPVPTLGPRPQPVPEARVLVKPTPKPDPVRSDIAGGGSSLRGTASWYCNSNGSRGPISACHYQHPDTSGFDAYPAAGPKLREALGSGWRGRVVSVDGIAVKLVDWCQCYKGERSERLIDLYYDVYRRVGGSVTVSW